MCVIISKGCLFCKNTCLACVLICLILASISVLRRYGHTCMMEFVCPLEESIAINDVSGSSLDEVSLASPPPPMPTLSLYILKLEGNTSTSGMGWPKLPSCLWSTSVLRIHALLPWNSRLTNRQTRYSRKVNTQEPLTLDQDLFSFYNSLYNFGGLTATP